MISHCNRFNSLCIGPLKNSLFLPSRLLKNSLGQTQRNTREYFANPDSIMIVVSQVQDFPNSNGTPCFSIRPFVASLSLDLVQVEHFECRWGDLTKSAKGCQPSGLSKVPLDPQVQVLLDQINGKNQESGKGTRSSNQLLKPART